MALGAAGSVPSGRGNSGTTHVTPVQCYGTGFTYDYDDTPTDLTGTFASYYTYTGTGKFIGFELKLDHKDTAFQLEIDGVVLFEFENNDIETNGNGGDLLGISWEPNRKTVTFYPRFPICFGTSVDINCKETDGSHTLLASLVNIVKES